MSCTRQQLLDKMKEFLGCKEGDAIHRKIIDTYNGYIGKNVLSYTSEWCAAAISAAAIMCNATDIIPVDAYTPYMLNKFKSMGEWEENDAYTPLPGDVVFYDWDDVSDNDNTSTPNHVGVVETISNNMITTIEGNYSTTKSCARRTFPINWVYIRGYGIPKYLTDKRDSGLLRYGDEGTDVKKLQDRINRCKDRLKILLYPYLMEDAIFGSMTQNAVQQIQSIHGITVDGIVGSNTNSVLDQKYSVMTLPKTVIKQGDVGASTARLQTALNIAKLIQGDKTYYAKTNVDGIFGPDTDFAVRYFQSGNSLTSDGIVGAKTWAKLIQVLGCK